MKKLTKCVVAAMAVLMTGMATPAAWSADSTSASDFQKGRERLGLDVPLGTVYTGRSPYNPVQMAPAPAPAPVRMPAPAPMPRPAEICSVTTTGPARLGKTMPAQVAFGQTFEYQLRVTAVDCVNNVVVTDEIPAGASFVKSDPATTPSGNALSWNLGRMDSGETKTIKVWLKADKEGKLASCATIKADPIACGSTIVGRPTLAIEKTGPAEGLVGQNITYNIVVKNTGSMTAENVVVTDAVPSGLSHSSGQSSLSYNVGNLAPGTSRQIPVTFRADRPGKVCNKAIAKSTNAGEVDDEACTVILKPGLAIEKTGIPRQFLGKTAPYEIVVKNTGDTTLQNVVVTDTVPPNNRVADAGGGTVTGNIITWNLGSLAKGGTKSLKVSLAAVAAGRYCNLARVDAAGGLTAQSEACTEWTGYPAILIEVVDSPDPLLVGEETTYTIKVTNQGTADDTNIKIVVNFPVQTDPVAAAGATAGTISGKTVNFAPFPRLAPKQVITWTVRAKAVSTGDSRLKVLNTSDLLKNPVTEEESTQVY